MNCLMSSRSLVTQIAYTLNFNATKCHGVFYLYYWLNHKRVKRVRGAL